jgi:phosphatidylinositol 4-kinase A
MSMKELDILLALCKVAPRIKDLHNAEKLLQYLSPYLLEASTQVFATSPFLKAIKPSPWEALSYGLYSAVLAVGSNHSSLRAVVRQNVTASLEQCFNAVDSYHQIEDNKEPSDSGSESNSMAEKDKSVEIATITVSILGFLEAAAAHAHFWLAADLLPLIQRVQEALSEDFLISVETALSTIRNSHATEESIKNWKGYIRSYAAAGQPLGAMLLQRNFLRMALAFGARFVTTSRCSDEKDLLEFMIAESGKTTLSELAEARGATPDLLEKLTDVAVHEMSLIEDGADFVKLGSTWQQRLAFSVKSSALTLYTICNEIDTEVAEFDSLVSWLDDTTSDPVQMADEVLAGTVLRCMTVLAKNSPAYAASLSRSLPRFIVQSAPRGSIVAVAADCLAFVLQLVSQDAVITTLYTLGNVLTSASGAEKTENGGLTPGGRVRVHEPPDHHEKNTMGSAISLTLSSEENMSVVHGNVIQAIIGIAVRCKNEEITALAQSMLVQKIGKVNPAVDARMISETAKLASVGGVLEFKSLLRLYSNLCHDSIIKENDLILNAVSLVRKWCRRL